MTITAVEVQKAYLAYFGRPADTAGLTYWMASDAVTMKAGFAASAEYASLYTGLTVDQRVEQVYQNLLGRASDAAGKAHWVAAFNAGRETVSSLVDAMQINALNEDIATINNRVSYATDFTAALDTPAEIAGYVGTGAANAARASVAPITTAATMTTATAAIATAVTTVVAASTTTGKLADGYIRSATVFADANGDGIWNTGEAKTTTDANGNFTLQGATGKLVASGGTDISTNLAFHGVFTAADGSGMINPLTTLVESMVSGGSSLEAAQTQVLAALGLPTTTNLLTLDAMAVALGSGTTAEKAAAAQVQAATAKVANILVQGAAIIQGASGSTSAADAAATMATALAANFTAATGTVDLTQTSVLQSVMTAAAADTSTAATTAVAASLTNIGSVMSGANTAINAAMSANPTDLTAALSQIAKVQVVAQGDAATSLTTGMAAGSIATTVTSFTGTGLTTAVTAADAGTLAPGVEATGGTPVVAPAGGGGGDSGGGSSLVNQSLDALAGTISSPATFDAASAAGIFNFTDTVGTASFTRITNFGANDSISISNVGSNHLIVANNGADVVLTVNANGIVSQITLVGVTAATEIIGSVSAFNALSVGDVAYS